MGLLYRFIVCDKFCIDKNYRIRSHQNLVQQKAKPVISKSTNAEKPKSEFSGFDRSSRTSNIPDSERFLKGILKVGLVLKYPWGNFTARGPKPIYEAQWPNRGVWKIFEFQDSSIRWGKFIKPIQIIQIQFEWLELVGSDKVVLNRRMILFLPLK